jgi:hypothetical protein
MREILFRGKRPDNSEWVYGFFHPGIDGNGKRVFCISTDKDCPDTYIIIPETRCQYTGLDDKNGVKIFEGDVLSHYGDTILVSWNHKNACFDFNRINRDCLYKTAACGISEVIGNIHDNPELLEAQ